MFKRSLMKHSCKWYGNGSPDNLECKILLHLNDLDKWKRGVYWIMIYEKNIRVNVHYGWDKGIRWTAGGSM